jgi:glycolate oxidase iron-sulfur subunit
MRTDFAPELLAEPAMATSEAAIRKCVHCGFCTATCPTYVLLGDELDSPRGRIYLMKEMLEQGRDPSPTVVKHIDRCLSCLSCMTTCPSGVHYMHLVDHARAYIEARYRRPWIERMIRALLATTLPHPRRFRLALRLARIARPFAYLIEDVPALKPIAAMLALAPQHVPAAAKSRNTIVSAPKGRVILMQGCAEPVLRPEIRAATVRLLTRAGHEVAFAPGEACCGALVHHMGREQEALAASRRNVDAWIAEADRAAIDAIVITASGCGTTIKDYGHMLRDDPSYAAKAAKVSALAVDISELLARIEMPTGHADGMIVAYHPACSLQHGQKVIDAPKGLLADAGFAVRVPAEAHLCCGSAGTYNILQPDIAAQLGDRKAAAIAALTPQVIATGNIGCATQIAQRTDIPVVHLVELLDWATGGPRPSALKMTPHILKRKDQ